MGGSTGVLCWRLCVPSKPYAPAFTAALRPRSPPLFPPYPQVCYLLRQSLDMRNKWLFRPQVGATLRSPSLNRFCLRAALRPSARLGGLVAWGLVACGCTWPNLLPA